jgi:hypothetical protein
MDQQRSNPDPVGNGHRLQQRVPQQGSAEPMTLLANIDPETRQDHNRDRMAAGPVCKPPWSVLRLNPASAQRIEAGDRGTADATRNVDARRVGLLG